MRRNKKTGWKLTRLDIEMDKEIINKRNYGNKKLSLYPLKFEDAVKDLLKVRPEKEVRKNPDKIKVHGGISS